MEQIQLKNVSKVYKTGDTELKAIDGVDLKINKGEFVVVLGVSGAGKSTLLNLLGGLDKAGGGEIIIDGDNIAAYSDRQLTQYRARRVGFIFQFYNLIPTLTVLENVSLIREVMSGCGDAAAVLTSVGLGEHLNKFPAALSGGEQQRVSIARALVKKPDLLLCDEPTGALDSSTGAEILTLLKQCAAGGQTVIVVTHNAAIAASADRVIKVHNGKIESAEVNKKPLEISEIKL